MTNDNNANDDLEDKEELYLSSRERYLNDLKERTDAAVKLVKEFFEPGKLYQINLPIPYYKSKLDLDNKYWSWLGGDYNQYSHIYTNNFKEKKLVVMFISMLENSYDHHLSPSLMNIQNMFYFPLPTINKSITQATCLQFLLGKHVIYIPVVPGQQSKLFTKHDIV